jgi:hypothetical protein
MNQRGRDAGHVVHAFRAGESAHQAVHVQDGPPAVRHAVAEPGVTLPLSAVAIKDHDLEPTPQQFQYQGRAKKAHATSYNDFAHGVLV